MAKRTGRAVHASTASPPRAVLPDEPRSLDDGGHNPVSSRCLGNRCCLSGHRLLFARRLRTHDQARQASAAEPLPRRRRRYGEGIRARPPRAAPLV